VESDMPLLDSVKPEKWYSVDETAAILGFERDSVIRRIQDGQIQAFILPRVGKRRNRVYRSYRIQGAEIIRYVSVNMTRAVA
jgi:hypothetical protein